MPNFRYFRPSSITWWAGFAAIVLGVLELVAPSDAASELGRLVTLLMGGVDASPAGLIVLGLGLIGIRDKIERG